MKVFISWSGRKSLKVAELLRDWLPNLFANNVEPWISSQDIKAGQRGTQQIAEQLKDAGMGIICLTSGNLEAPWIQFEAGAISKSVERCFVCTYLIELEVADLPGQNPLTQFQASKADKDGTWRIVTTINELVNAYSPERLRVVFEKWWQDLDGDLKNLRPDDGEPSVHERSPSELLSELVVLARRQAYDSDVVMPEIVSRLQQIQKELEQQRPARLFGQIAETQNMTLADVYNSGGRYRRTDPPPMMNATVDVGLGGKPQKLTGLEGAASERGEERGGA